MCFGCFGHIFSFSEGVSRRQVVSAAAKLALGAGAAAGLGRFRAEAATPSNPSGKADALYFGGDIVTMAGETPEIVEAIAVRDGRIMFVGSKAEATQLADAGTTLVDLGGKTLLPGFIDPHLHPVQGAAMIMPVYITPFDWKFPWGDAKAVRGHDAFVARVVESEKALKDPNEPLIIWGYLKPYHGDLNRPMLDAISTARPIIVWSYSAHEMYFNTPALQSYGLTADEVDGNTQVDYANGIYREAGFIEFAVPKVKHLLMDEAKLTKGLSRLEQLAHQGGVTTLGDMGTGSSGDIDADVAAIRSNLEKDELPFRMRLVPDVKTLDLKLSRDEAKSLARGVSLPAQNSHHLLFGPQVKLYADGAFFAEAMQLDPPGYNDGHEGQWMMPPERLKQLIELYWTNGYDIHIHCNGSLALSTILGKLEELQTTAPRGDQRLVIEHFGVSTAEQAAQIGRLGVVVSANPYYLYTMADTYAEGSLGKERASEIVRLGSLRKNNVPFALHSDFTMAPIDPLLLTWIAVNRVTANGTEMAPHEKVSVYDAFRGVTANAAYVLRLEDETGSLVAGKKADFVILAENPMKVDPMTIKDIRVVETVFEGGLVLSLDGPATGFPQAALQTYHAFFQGSGTDADADAANDAVKAVAQKIIEVPGTDISIMRLKARVYLWAESTDLKRLTAEGSDWEAEAALASLFRDLGVTDLETTPGPTTMMADRVAQHLKAGMNAATPASPESERDRRHSRAFMDLEPKIRDLTHMAELARLHAIDTFGSHSPDET